MYVNHRRPIDDGQPSIRASYVSDILTAKISDENLCASCRVAFLCLGHRRARTRTPYDDDARDGCWRTDDDDDDDDGATRAESVIDDDDDANDDDDDANDDDG